jgi:hypothetical protein
MGYRPQQPDPATHTIGTLCVGGDWACAHGDLEALGDVALRLASYTASPLHGELVALASLIHADPERATATWVHLRPRLLVDLASTPRDSCGR